MSDVDDDEFLKTGWDDMDGEHIQAYAESKNNGWTADQVSQTWPVLGLKKFCADRLTLMQVWGFEEVVDKRYYVRHVVVRKGDEWKQARFVYDYQR